MTYILVVLAIITIIAFLFRKLTKVHVMTMFLTNYKTYLEHGEISTKALKSTINFFRYRRPFAKLTDNDVSNIVDVMKNLREPHIVCASIFQQCEENNQKISKLKDPDSLLHWTLTEDLITCLIDIMKQGKSYTNINRNIMDGIVMSLRNRPDWTPVKQEENGILFKYKDKHILIKKQNTGLEIAKLILFAELSDRAENPKNKLDGYIQNSIINNFDKYFNESWNSISKK